MNTLAQLKRGYPTRLIGPWPGRVQNGFAALNNDGWITILAVVVISGAAAAYLFSLIASFNIGLETRALANEGLRREQEVRRLEIALREGQSQLASRHHDILENMAAVSAVRYLIPGGIAVSQVSTITSQ